MARFFGVPPFLMMETEKSTSWGTGLEQQSLGFVRYDLHPQWLAPTEQRVSKELTGADTAKAEAVYATLIKALKPGDVMVERVTRGKDLPLKKRVA